MSRQPHEVLGDDPESVIDLYAVPPSVIPIRPAKPRPLAQVELPVTFSGHTFYLCLDVFGKPGTSDMTGKAILEDTRFELNGEDIEHLLPDDLLDAIADYVLDN